MNNEWGVHLPKKAHLSPHNSSAAFPDKPTSVIGVHPNPIELLNRNLKAILYLAQIKSIKINEFKKILEAI